MMHNRRHANHTRARQRRANTTLNPTPLVRSNHQVEDIHLTNRNPRRARDVFRAIRLRHVCKGKARLRPLHALLCGGFARVFPREHVRFYIVVNVGAQGVA